MKLTHLLIACVYTSLCFSQVPSNYYDSANGLSGYTLKTELRNIITTGHSDQGYTALWTAYSTSDRDIYYESDNTILDIYTERPTQSDTYNFTYSTDQCGSYSTEGDCYNREHIVPQSSFGSASPMRNDIHQVFPTDGYVNGIRDTHPFGIVATVTYTSSNGSKRGNSNVSGYSGTMFEPIDEFKGDVARALLYFAVRYQNNVDTYTFDMFNGTEDQVFETWALDMLLDWHYNIDPVDQRDIDRNNAAYNFQGNANPFVDHPEYANMIWNPTTGTTEVSDSGSQPLASNFSSLNDTSAEAVSVFEINIEDQNPGDGLATLVTNIRLYPHTTNTADWTDNIQGVTLSDGSSISVNSVNITDSFIDIDIISGNLSVADTTTKTISVAVYLNTATITDNAILSFMVDADNHGFTADNSGSEFVTTFASGDFNSNNFTINVVATELQFTTQPSSATVGNAISPAVVVAATDINGNVDTDYTSNISITSTGTLTGTPVTQGAINGEATFSSLTHSVVGNGLTLTASDGSFTNITSNTFNITNTSSPVVIAIEDFDSTTPNWTNDIASQTFVDPTSPDQGLFIQAASTDNVNFSGNSAFGRDLGGETGEPTLSPYTFTFDNVSVSDFTSVEVSFDYYVFANAEIGNYELFLNGVGQGSVEYFNDPDTGQVGTITIPVANGTTTVGLQLTGTLNGSSDVLEFDNFKVTGLFNGLVYSSSSWSPNAPSNTTNTDNALIVDGTYIVNSEINLNSLSTLSGAGVTIEKTGSLQLASNLTTADNLTLQSDSDEFSSLIVSGSITGTVTYERFTAQIGPVGTNDLITPPVSGQTFSDFATNNSGVLAASGTVRAFAPFNKTSEAYENYDTVADAAVTLNAGTGYRAATNTGSNLTFSGSVNTTTVNIPIANSGTNYAPWNLIGNPFPSYLDVDSFISTNQSQMLAGSVGVYGYDGDASDGWIVYNLASSGIVMTPGQGFYVAATSGGGSVDFTAAMRTIGSGDDFITGRIDNTSNSAYAKLNLSYDTNMFGTDIYFIDGTTQSLDPGYDTTAFNNNAAGIFTALVQNSTDEELAIQSLPYNDVDDVIIPLGIKVNAGIQATISLNNVSNLPSYTHVYLEDTVENIWTLLNSHDYTFNSSTNLDGTGRFYIHFNANALSNSEYSFDNISIYTPNNNSIVIKGQLNDNTSFSLFDMQGRLVLSRQLDNNLNTNTVLINSISSGVYLVKLDNNNVSKAQKIIIK